VRYVKFRILGFKVVDKFAFSHSTIPCIISTTSAKDFIRITTSFPTFFKDEVENAENEVVGGNKMLETKCWKRRLLIASHKFRYCKCNEKNKMMKMMMKVAQSC